MSIAQSDGSADGDLTPSPPDPASDPSGCARATARSGDESGDIPTIHPRGLEDSAWGDGAGERGTWEGGGGPH